jgi:hypothetical protein
MENSLLLQVYFRVIICFVPAAPFVCFVFQLCWGCAYVICSTVGGWLPEWDFPQRVAIIKPNKGHLRERIRPERFETVTKAMAGMDARIAKMRAVITLFTSSENFNIQ